MSAGATRHISLGAIALAALATSGCFAISTPGGAQITCSAENRWCPGALECCNNQRCLPPEECEAPACPDGMEPCSLDEAIDCERGLRCTSGCWRVFDSYRLVCDDPHYLPCELDGFSERWYCPQTQTCVVRISGGAPEPHYRGECYQPPTQCAGTARHSCACLTAPFSISPPCSPWEMCDDGFTGCVACREGVPDYDVLDASENLREDAQVLVMGGDQAPVCYDSIGSSALIGNCCDPSGTPASYDEEGGSYVCVGGDFATSCEGYGDECLAGAPAVCGAGDDCLWSWYGSAGLHCAADGPASPCVDGSLECVAGSSLRVSCDCVAPGCPG